METKTIIILVFILFGWYWYNNPVEGRDLLEKGVNTTQSLIGKAQATLTCDDTYDPVCAGGVTYDNQCKADKAGKTNITLGVCI